ncbi:MAG: hypothetical protein GX601_05610 [Anaerolineales bacterium]|nr:hypothetical protein [Anaerolineales bacterium]
MNKLTREEREDLLNVLQDAQEHMMEAIEGVRRYVRDTGDSNAKAYLLDHMIIMASNNHSFLTRDISIETLMERLMDDENFDDGGEA